MVAAIGRSYTGAQIGLWYPVPALIGRPATVPSPRGCPNGPTRTEHEVHPMSTARPTLAAAARETTGKAVSRLRRDGRLPGVVYGHGVASSNVSVDTHEFELLRRHVGPNALVDLSVDGKKAKPVLVHGVQVHPVTRRPLHVDLFLVRMTEELTVDVPLVPTGTSEAIEDLGGTLNQQTDSVRIKALPDHLPQSIEYSIESLVDFDTTIHVSDLAIPGDVTLLSNPEDVVAKVLPPRVEVEEEPVVAEGEEAEAAEGAEGAPAAEGAAEGGAETSGEATESES
jgi:large subunit ribosomal protein L25